LLEDLEQSFPDEVEAYREIRATSAAVSINIQKKTFKFSNTKEPLNDHGDLNIIVSFITIHNNNNGAFNPTFWVDLKYSRQNIFCFFLQNELMQVPSLTCVGVKAAGSITRKST
jgi:hypothetical protein